MNTPTAYEEIERLHRTLLRQEELIVEVTEALASQLESSNTLKVELANRLGKSKSYVSQLLSGGRNLTLRTLAEVADALNARVKVVLEPDHKSALSGKWSRSKVLPIRRRVPLAQGAQLEEEADCVLEAMGS